MSTLIFNLKGPELEQALKDLQARIVHTFNDQSLLMEALTHPSAASEQQSGARHNQRLEFLGDAVLQIILSDYLFEKEKNAQEGLLTRMRSYLAREEATANYSLMLGLDRVLQLGHGECANGGRYRPSILGDLFEAFLGALHLDAGYAKARDLVLSLIPTVEQVKAKLTIEENPKGALQELCQSLHLGSPEYRKLAKVGPIHSPVYTIAVFVNSKEIGRADGNSVHNAEKSAALAAWHKIKEESMKTTEPIYALDFDGVICDSARETGTSGWLAARKIWPDLFTTELPNEEQIQAFRRIRPCLETGYEAILLNKMIQENIPVEDIEANCAKHIERIMSENHLGKAQLVALFGATRDAWIQRDLDNWLDTHGFFDGVIDALKTALENGKRIMILTTKQERFVLAALKSKGIDFPPENLYGLDRKCKKEIQLAEFMAQHPSKIHFVEDRIKTLLRVEMVPELESVKLYYADWGYGTKNDLSIAETDPHITTFSLEKFCKWLEDN